MVKPKEAGRSPFHFTVVIRVRSNKCVSLTPFDPL